MNSFTQLKRHRNLAFWSLHALGWTAYGIAHYLGAVVYSKPPDYLANYVKVIVAASASGLVATAPLRYVCRWLWEKPPALLIGVGLAAAWITALAWRVCVNFAYRKLMPGEWEMHGWMDYFSGAISATYLTACWVGLYLGFRYYESMQMQRELALRSSALAQEAQLKMLRYQLNPHFLFNTLNAISTLIIDNRNSVANSAVTGLSEFLRYTLDQDPMKKVTVAQEIDALNLYLNIEKMRFERRLRIEYEIADEARNVLMPSLLLQPLIENAIKYAVSPREEGGRIAITGRVVAGRVAAGHVWGPSLELTVCDDGPGMIDPTRLTNGRGVGIRNTRERLQVLYGERATVEVVNTNPGLRVTATFPAERTTSF